jgi:hypothetical protein
MKRRVAAAMALTMLLAGCGSYTKKDFVSAADAICAGATRKTRTVTPPSFTGGPAQHLSALAGYLEQVTPIVRSEATKLRALRRPSQSPRDTVALTNYLTAMTRAAGEYDELAAGAKRGDAGAVSNAEAALRANPVTALARTYGLRSCAAPVATVAGSTAA